MASLTIRNLSKSYGAVEVLLGLGEPTLALEGDTELLGEERKELALSDPAAER